MVDDPDGWHAAVAAEVERMADRLCDVAAALLADPELAFAEHRAADRLCAEPADGGSRSSAGRPGCPPRSSPARGPATALGWRSPLEYDALPGLGHACGHNLIAAAGLGAALAVHRVQGDVPGTVLAIGTPAEEGGGGKVVEVEAGVFDGVDAAPMFHPGAHSWRWAPLTTQVELRIAFHGRAAHPTGNPTEGVDALASLVQLFTALAMLRQRLPAGSHVQGIVTRGGEAANIVPDLAEGLFGLRGLTTAALDDLVGQVSTAARGIAAATGTTVDVTPVRAPYSHFRDNEVLSSLFGDHLAAAGIPLSEPEPGVFLGSSDIGNVSTAVPAIHPFVAIVDADQSDHTPEFAAAAASTRGHTAMLAAARALASTAVDVLTRTDTAAAAWAEFDRRAAASD